jgi:hypothetical protein
MGSARGAAKQQVIGQKRKGERRERYTSSNVFV